jgi:hypothetical protein
MDQDDRHTLTRNLVVQIRTGHSKRGHGTSPSRHAVERRGLTLVIFGLMPGNVSEHPCGRIFGLGMSRGQW